MSRLILVAAGIFTLVIGCNTGSNTNNNNTSSNSNSNKVNTQKITVPVPNFNADSAYQFVKVQVDFGPRVPNTKAHALCAAWLVNQFKSFGAGVHIQEAALTTYDNKNINLQNIIVQIRPDLPKRILLSAHWDTRPVADEDTIRKDEPILGANDGGSGVAVLLEIARQLQHANPNIGVDIFLWDAEDMGSSEVENSYCLGSQHWAKNILPPNYKPLYGINLDMVGAAGAQFTQEGISMQYARDIVEKVWQTAHQAGYGAYFLFLPDGNITDDHLYINRIAGIRCIDIIHRTPEQRGFFKQWHTHGDNMQVISKETLKAVGQTLLEVIFREGANS